MTCKLMHVAAHTKADYTPVFIDGSVLRISQIFSLPSVGLKRRDKYQEVAQARTKTSEKKLHFVESRSADQGIITVLVSCSLYLLHANVLDALTIFLKIMKNTSEHRQFFSKHALPCFGFKKPETEINHEEPSHPYSPTHAASSFLKTATPSMALRDSFLRRTSNPASATFTFQSTQSISEQADEMRARGAKRAVRVDKSLAYLQRI
jgi:hypothetical protein